MGCKSLSNMESSESESFLSADNEASFAFDPLAVEEEAAGALLRLRGAAGALDRFWFDEVAAERPPPRRLPLEKLRRPTG